MERHTQIFVHHAVRVSTAQSISGNTCQFEGLLQRGVALEHVRTYSYAHEWRWVELSKASLYTVLDLWQRSSTVDAVDDYSCKLDAWHVHREFLQSPKKKQDCGLQGVFLRTAGGFPGCPCLQVDAGNERPLHN